MDFGIGMIVGVLIGIWIGGIIVWEVIRNKDGEDS